MKCCVLADGSDTEGSADKKHCGANQDINISFAAILCKGVVES